MASLQDLGAEVAKLSEALASQLKAGNHPEPSFAVDGPERYPHDPAIQMARFQLLDKVRDLLYLTTGPADFAFMEVPLFAQHDVINLNVLNEFDFFGIVPVQGGASYAEVAKATQLPEELVRRLLRYSFTMRVFAPDGPDRVAHTPFSAYVARNPTLKSWIGHNGDECRTAGLGFVAALREFTVGRPEVSQEIDEGGFSMIMPRRKDGSRTDFWKAAEDEPWRVERFAEAMQVAGASALVSVGAVIDSFDWAGLGNAIVVDVGGSDGHIMVPVARKNPGLSVVVQDLPRLEPDFKKLMSGAASDVAPRFTWQAHDFFKPQPELPGGKEADVFFLKHILHDWPEKYAVKILQGLIPGLKKPGARILLCDSLIPPLEDASKLPTVAQKGMAMADMQMMMMFNAQERTPDIYARVVAKADPKLKIKNMTSIPGAMMSLIELALE